MEAAGLFSVASHKAYIDFLEGVSDEEKTSLKWAQDRGAGQWAYEHHAKANGQKPENAVANNLIVQLFVRAYDELADTKDPSQDAKTCQLGSRLSNFGPCKARPSMGSVGAFRGIARQSNIRR